MGIYGSAFDVSEIEKNGVILSFLNYDTGVHTMYSGIDWIYTHVETLYMYEYKIMYFWLLNSIYDESMDFFFYPFGIFHYTQQVFKYFDQLS